MASLTFKEQIVKDAHDVFLNLEEFAEIVTINGRQMSALIEDDDNADHPGANFYPGGDSIYSKRKMISVAADEYGGTLPVPGEPLTLNKKKYVVTKSVNDIGMFIIHCTVPEEAY